MMSKPSAIGIVIGGGPAPGINACIASIVIEALNNDIKVFGFVEGYKYLMASDIDESKVIELDESKIEGKDHIGGSILRTSRANPTVSEKEIKTVLKNLKKYNIKMFVTIGGFYTGESTAKIAQYSNGEVKICHVPKTIDDDLPLPSGIPTFGKETATEIGSEVVRNLMNDAETANRFFIVLSMGRTAGHLALSIGKSAGAHCTIIPEQFNLKEKEVITFDKICKCIESCVLQRVANGDSHGVIVIAEGVIERLADADLKKMFGEGAIKRDPYGHLVLADLDIGQILREEMRERAEKYNTKVGFMDKRLGYELRCSPPNAFDLEYARDLGYGAVRFLLSGGNCAMITIQAQKMIPIPFSEVINKGTGKMKVRLVDIEAEGYKVAQSYMIAIKKKTLEDEKQLKALSEIAGVSSEEFKKKFQDVVIQ